jgi:hypothetical protein
VPEHRRCHRLDVVEVRHRPPIHRGAGLGAEHQVLGRPRARTPLDVLLDERRRLLVPRPGHPRQRHRAGLAERLKLPNGNVTNTTFLTTVKGLLASAEIEKELLVQEGMTPTSLDDLGRMVSEFETALEGIRTGRRDRIGAHADLEVITTELLGEIKVLDGITRYRFGKNPEVMAEWKAIRQVLGQPRAEVTPPAAGDGAVQGGVAPAA